MQVQVQKSQLNLSSTVERMVIKGVRRKPSSYHPVRKQSPLKDQPETKTSYRSAEHKLKKKRSCTDSQAVISEQAKLTLYRRMGGNSPGTFPQHSKNGVPVEEAKQSFCPRTTDRLVGRMCFMVQLSFNTDWVSRRSTSGQLYLTAYNNSCGQTMVEVTMKMLYPLYCP